MAEVEGEWVWLVSRCSHFVLGKVANLKQNNVELQKIDLFSYSGNRFELS